MHFPVRIFFCFQAEKLNITFVNPKSGIGLLSDKDKEKVKETQDKNRQLLGIPRRLSSQLHV
jgi:large subunit GTPase 1